MDWLINNFPLIVGVGAILCILATMIIVLLITAYHLSRMHYHVKDDDKKDQ